MCGIAGFLSTTHGNSRSLDVLTTMLSTLSHRGPDDFGTWLDPDAGIGLGHRRLSILDLSPAGHQPMHSESGRYVIVFNGEIYNHSLVRNELDKVSSCRWRGHSDTEIILAAVEKWGIDGALKRFVGMFSIALWDKNERTLTLARDRIGEKPLYYGWNGNTFLFASELKAFKAYPAFSPEIDTNSIALQLRYCYIPAPHTIYKGIRKLIPGTTVSIRLNEQNGRYLEPVPYWSAHAIAEDGMQHPFCGTDQEAIDALESLLFDSIGMQMVADVPLGAFLSGGVDSSTIVTLMQAQSVRPVKTFTIGFHEERYNEAEYAKSVAKHLGTDHTELYVTPEDALAVIPKLPSLYDEPFSDSSQIPTFLVSQLTRSHVTVSLSGDGGDELFGGYNRYCWGQEIWSNVGWTPKCIRSALAAGLRSLSPHIWDRIFAAITPILPHKFRQRLPGDKLHKLAEVIDVTNPVEMYRKLVSSWKSPDLIVRGAVEPEILLADRRQWLNTNDVTLQMMFLDMITFLPDDILVKVDRAAMGVSLETRVPFLDHRVVEFAWKLPLNLKIRNGVGKWALRQVLYRYVPKELIERPKTGFSIPLDAWLRGSLRDWAESLLNEERLKREGFFHPAPIRQKWVEHLSGQRNWQYHLWDVLMFQAWLEAQRP